MKKKKKVPGGRPPVDILLRTMINIRNEGAFEIPSGVDDLPEHLKPGRKRGRRGPALLTLQFPIAELSDVDNTIALSASL